MVPPIPLSWLRSPLFILLVTFLAVTFWGFGVQVGGMAAINESVDYHAIKANMTEVAIEDAAVRAVENESTNYGFVDKRVQAGVKNGQVFAISEFMGYLLMPFSAGMSWGYHNPSAAKIVAQIAQWGPILVLGYVVYRLFKRTWRIIW